MSVVRIVIVVILLGVVVLAFANGLGPVRGVFRGILVLGAFAIILSYVVEWLQKRRR